jgi:hypothetical protein
MFETLHFLKFVLEGAARRYGGMAVHAGAECVTRLKCFKNV